MSLVRIPLSSMQPHIDGAVRQGLALDALLARAFIDTFHGDDRDLISPAQALLLCLNTVISMEDATHGLARTGMRRTYPAIGLTMALGRSTLEGGLLTLAKLYAQESNAVRIQLRTEQDSAVLAIQTETKQDRDAAYLEENFLMWLFMQIFRFLGHLPFVADVTVREPFHFNLGRPHWVMQGTVRYGDVTAFRFPRRLLAAPPGEPAGDDIMWECHKLLLDYLDGGSGGATPNAFVTDGTFVRFTDLVRQSGKSPNTLRRHLRTTDQGFREARQRALVKAAYGRLTEGEDTVETIAADLGYSDTRSFRRFLKMATGLTPQEIRVQQNSNLAEANARARLAIKTLGKGLNI
jgi:AraC-like DNA-binding protein